MIIDENDILNTFKNKSFFVTGATGLIGSALVNKLLALSHDNLLNIKIYGFVRDKVKADKIFGADTIEYVVGDFDTNLELPNDIDYIFHCATPTDSKYFIEKPVETFVGNLSFVSKLINVLREREIDSFVFLSSLEVYGTSERERRLREDSVSYYNMLNVRNSYPLAKIAIEELLFMTYREYGLPVKIARLAQTFGRGVTYWDNRVFAQFARCVVENKNIVLKSNGETLRNYCSVDDAVNALIYIAVGGEAGEAYNVASDETAVTILRLAELFCAQNNSIKIEFDIQDQSTTGYLPTNRIILETAKLKNLGWQSHDNIDVMVKSLCNWFKTADNR